MLSSLQTPPFWQRGVQLATSTENLKKDDKCIMKMNKPSRTCAIKEVIGIDALKTIWTHTSSTVFIQTQEKFSDILYVMSIYNNLRLSRLQERLSDFSTNPAGRNIIFRSQHLDLTHPNVRRS